MSNHRTSFAFSPDPKHAPARPGYRAGQRAQWKRSDAKCVIEGVTVPRREQKILGRERCQGAGASLTSLMTRLQRFQHERTKVRDPPRCKTCRVIRLAVPATRLVPPGGTGSSRAAVGVVGVAKPRVTASP